MRNLFALPLLALLFIFSACEGDPGPPGPPGDPGINILGQVFEVTVNFGPGNNYSQLITIPTTIEVFESDVILVYRFEGSDGNADIWAPLPQTYFPNGNTLLYTFNHTFFDVELIMDGNFDLNTLDPAIWTNNQSFRIAVVPAEFGDANLTMEQLMNMENVELIGL